MSGGTIGSIGRPVTSDFLMMPGRRTPYPLAATEVPPMPRPSSLIPAWGVNRVNRRTCPPTRPVPGDRPDRSRAVSAGQQCRRIGPAPVIQRSDGATREGRGLALPHDPRPFAAFHFRGHRITSQGRNNTCNSVKPSFATIVGRAVATRSFTPPLKPFVPHGATPSSGCSLSGPPQQDVIWRS